MTYALTRAVRGNEMTRYRATQEQWSQWNAQAIQDLEYLLTAGTELLRRAKHGIRDGYPTSMRYDSVSSRGTSDPVAETTIAHIMHPGADPVRRAAQDATETMIKIRRELSEAVSIVKASLGNAEMIEPEYPKCRDCGRVVYQTPNDRLRAGRCPADYAKWRRSKKGDVAI